MSLPSKAAFQACLLIAWLLAAQPAMALDQKTASAVQSDLAYGRADSGIGLLQPALSLNSQDAEAHNLLCRFLYQEQRWDDAVRECELATKAAANSSTYHMWLGRAYGEKASRVSFVLAYGLGKRVRAEFETAVRLDPHNVAALSDLGEYYTEAPAIIGGGLDKASDIARELEPLDGARSHELRGRIAEYRQDAAGAEAEFKAAIRVSRYPAASWTVLASFYRKQQRWDDMMVAIRSAVEADKDHGVASTYAASALIRSNREPQLAMQLLDAYLASKKQSEEMPAFLIHVRLGKLLEQQGDKQGAQREFQSARLLAREYRGLP